MRKIVVVGELGSVAQANGLLLVRLLPVHLPRVLLLLMLLLLAPLLLPLVYHTLPPSLYSQYPL